MVTVPSAAQFLVVYPEFSKCPLALVDAKLAQAARWTNELTYDAGTEGDAVMMKAAALLAVTPDARKLQLVADDQLLVWQRQLYRLQKSAVCGVRVF